MAEHLDLRHVMGIGIAITRGSAAALSFNYSVLLLSMLVLQLATFNLTVKGSVSSRWRYCSPR